MNIQSILTTAMASEESKASGVNTDRYAMLANTYIRVTKGNDM